jgi:hypothetical protein
VTCPHEELICRFLDGDLPPRELREAEVHIEACPACRLYFHEAKAREGHLREVVHRVAGSFHIGERVMRRIITEGLRPEPAAGPAGASPRTGDNPASGLSAWGRPAFSLVVLGVALVLAVGIFLHLKQNIGTVGGTRDLVLVTALGPGARVDGYPLAMRDSVRLGVGRAREFEGKLALRTDAAGQAQVTWQGRGFFAPTRDGVEWSSGVGEFACQGGAPFVIGYRDEQIALQKGRLRVRGNVYSRLQIDLIEGTALRRQTSAPQPVSGTLVLPGSSPSSGVAEVVAPLRMPGAPGDQPIPSTASGDRLVIPSETGFSTGDQPEQPGSGSAKMTIASDSTDLPTASGTIASLGDPLDAPPDPVPDPEPHPANPFGDGPISPGGL